MKPWRENIVPHRDVLEGTFQQSEFAADLDAVRDGTAPREYQDAVSFFERTFITEGMRLLLTQVAQRLAGRGGEPVIQLQTAFGGGKTHTMLAVYHLAARAGSLADLAGVPAIIDKAGLMDLPRARVAVLDGNAYAPGQAWKHGSQSVHTLWGELAWQLGGAEAYGLVADADSSGTSPGKDVLKTLLAKAAPCVVLMDELVAYIRQFAEGKTLSGGTYDSNMSFVQALTEAVKQVPNAIVLASLPESEVEAGQRGVAALRALEKTFGRVQALWKPVETEESFEIVRRRLFEPVRDAHARDTVCRAFADTYVREGARLPADTQEGRYYDRLLRAYPIHPEVFLRLFEDWSTIDGFQRTRGVLKLMAKVIYRLWKDDNKDLMVLPGNIPLYDGNTRSELLYHLPAGWDPVIERDIDGDRAEPTELENRDPRFGQINAARRVARTVFFGSAPSSQNTKPGIRGLDRGRILLGCLQPDQASSTYSDALNRLADRLHYLNSSGDKTDDTTRFWFDTRANLRREMEDRKRRFDEKTQVRQRVAESVKKSVGSPPAFDGVHVFTPHADVPDDSSLRLVVLPTEAWYSKNEVRFAFEAVEETLRNHGTKPRYKSNRVLFLAPDQSSLSRLTDAARAALAWASIVDDVKEGRLNIDFAQKKQAEKELETAEAVLPRVVRECYKWLLCPVQETPTEPKPTVEAFPLNTAGGSLASEVERVCNENALVISTWSPIHLRTCLRDFYWKGETTAVLAENFWSDTQKYLYLPRLRTREVLSQAIRTGAATRDFFGVAYGQANGTFEGFQFGGSSAAFDDTLVLIAPESAKAYEEAYPPVSHVLAATDTGDTGATSPRLMDSGKAAGTATLGLATSGSSGVAIMKPSLAHSYHGTADIPAASARVRLNELAEELISLLSSDPNAMVRITVEISADYPSGVSDQIKRAVTENSKALGLKNHDWE